MNNQSRKTYQTHGLYQPSATIISDTANYALSDKDQEIFIFLKDKYLYNTAELTKNRCLWEDKA